MTLADFKAYEVKNHHFDEYSWQMRDKNYFKCNEILHNFESMKNELLELKKHSKFLSDRLIHQYGENENFDYHRKIQNLNFNDDYTYMI